MEGTTLGKYRVIGRLGAGGMGVVYVGEHELLGSRVAIKVINPELTRDEAVVARFLNEAVAAARIKHPGIVQIFDYGTDPSSGGAYFVMELLEGHDLAHRIAREGVLSPADATRVAMQIADTLRAAHAAGIVHRDLKPDNVFLVPDSLVPGGERVKLLDFGIAKLFGDGRAQSTTKTGDVLGTPYYMSPEQCHGAGAVDHRTDIYSLGCVLFQLVCGRVPFPGTGVGQVIGAHLHVPPPDPRALRPELPEPLAELVLQMLAKRADERLQSMDAVLGALAAVTDACCFPTPAPTATAQAARRVLTASTSAELAPTLAPASGPELALASTQASGSELAHAETAYAPAAPSGERAATQLDVGRDTLYEPPPGVAKPVASGPKASSPVTVIAAVAAAGVAIVAVLALALMGGTTDGATPPSAPPDPALVEPAPIEPALIEPRDALEPEGPPVAPEIQSLADLPAVDDVPALALRPVSAAKARRARARYYEGNKRCKAEEFADAIEEYIEGLRDDPGNIGARYNLASTYVLSGEPGKGLALLKQFKDDGCNFCLDRLIRARDDNDWRALFGHPVFEELTSGITVDVVGFEQAARELVKAITETGDPSAVEKLFHPRRPVTLTIEHQGCEPGGEFKCTERVRIRGTAPLSRWARDTFEDHEARDPQVVVGRLIECLEDGDDAGCCEFDSHGGQHNAYFLDEICFAVTSGTVPYLQSIDVRDEP